MAALPKPLSSAESTTTVPFLGVAIFAKLMIGLAGMAVPFDGRTGDNGGDHRQVLRLLQARGGR